MLDDADHDDDDGYCCSCSHCGHNAVRCCRRHRTRLCLGFYRHAMVSNDALHVPFIYLYVFVHLLSPYRKLLHIAGLRVYFIYLD